MEIERFITATIWYTLKWKTCMYISVMMAPLSCIHKQENNLAEFF